MAGRADVHAMAAFLLLAGWNYWPTLRWMEQRWDEPESYMAHGWLIPLVSLWLLWMERDRLRAAPKSGSIAGFFLVAGALVVHLVAGLADVSSISGLTIVPVIMGLVWLRFGAATLRIAWFPILFLFFMVPPPEFIISGMNFTLKLKAADLATFLLDATGLPSIRQGSFMMFGDQRLAIGDVCSGLRSLLALLSLGVLYAYLVRDKGRFHVLAVLATCVPAAIIGNGVRIFVVAYLVTWLGPATVFKPLIGSWDLHLFTGAFIFAADFACLYLVILILDKITAGKDA
jgi:exosortase